MAGYKAKMTSLRLLRAITFVADSLTELPIKIYLNMRLLYNDESKFYSILSRLET
jgi:hypothetical protein